MHQQKRRCGPLGYYTSSRHFIGSGGLDLLLHQSHHRTTDDNIREGILIVQQLGCLALALNQAAAYITFRHLPLVHFMDHYEGRKKTILEHTPGSVWEYRRSLGDGENQTSLNTFTTWEMSFQEIAEDDDERRNIGHLLTLAAFLNSAKISDDLFRMYLALSSPKPEWMQGVCSEGHWNSDMYQDTGCGLYNLIDTWRGSDRHENIILVTIFNMPLASITANH